MSPETRTKLTYFILGTVYFAGGIEKGVSVPRGWLHWHQLQDQAPDHVVGLVVASYSLATFFVAPFMGMWVDRPGRSKRMLITGVCLHITGAVLEFILINNWANIVARFLSGLGGGIDVVVLSETSRYTPLNHRTAAMALLVGSRLLGYMIVPGLDALLWSTVLKQIQLPERRTAASGVSLVILWGLILLLIIVFYTELCRLKPFSPHSSCHTVSSPQKHSSHQTNAHFAGTVRSGLGASYEVIEHGDSFSSSQPVSIPVSVTSSYCSQQTPEPQLARSSQMIEEAEKYIQKMAEQSYTSASARKPLGIDYCSSQNGEQQLSSELSEETNGRLSESFSNNQEWSSALASGRGADVDGNVSLMSSGTTDQGSYIQRYGALPYNLQGQESIFYILYQEIIRHDVVALLAILMSGSFSHLCFQILITPVTQWFLKGNTIYIIILFCTALVLLVAVCMLIWWFNPKQRTLHVMAAGAYVLAMGNVLFMIALSCMGTAEESQKENVLLVSVSLGLYVVGLLLLIICATSIFTTLTSPQHHGLSQGVYHSAVSLSAILAPLWIEGTLHQPCLHHGIIIGLLAFSMVLVFCSRKRLASRSHSTGRMALRWNRAQNIPTAPRQNSEEQPLL